MEEDDVRKEPTASWLAKHRESETAEAVAEVGEASEVRLSSLP